MSSDDQYTYDALILFSPADSAWALRLHDALRGRGLECLHSPMERGAEDIPEARAVVILWSRNVDAFPAVAEHGRDFVTVAIDEMPMPADLAGDKYVTLPPSVFEKGPDAAPEEWERLVDEIANAIRPRGSPIEPSLVFLKIPDPFAMGWLATPDLVVTSAAHIRDELEVVRFHATDDEVPVEVVAVRPENDPLTAGVALLRLLGPAPAGTHPALTGEPAPGTFHYMRRALAGVSVDEATVESPRENGTFDVEDVSLAPAGAPAWDPADGSVIGMLTRSQDLEDVWLVPMSHLARALPQLARRRTPPTARVHADRWTLEDQLGYALYARAIAEFVKHPDTTPPLVISVQGPWGQGKTSLMRMVQERLDPGHPDLVAGASSVPDVEPSALTFKDLDDSLEGDVPLGDVQPRELRTVWFNAWKYQSSEALWAGLAHAILQQLPARLARAQRERFWLKLQLRRIDPAAVRADIYRAAFTRFVPYLLIAGVIAALAAIAIVVGLAAGADVVAYLASGGLVAAVLTAAAGAVRSRRAALQRHLEGSYQRYVRQPDYTERMGYLHLVEEDMYRALDLLTPDDRPTVIFIDDLDRCSPAKIGEVIEAINLFLAGDYPNCVFVLGIDAEVVAAAMEVVHKDVIEKLGHRRGELGWRFMDKFVQLPFVMPRLNEGQRGAYLKGLLHADRTSAGRGEAVQEAERIRHDLAEGSLDARQAASRVGDIAPQYAAVDPDGYRRLAEDAIRAGAAEFTDDDPEIVEALSRQLQHLSDNPRTIKRAVNLYRFHRFAAWAREASPLGLEAAPPDLIARSIVPIVRWPHFVRWLQATVESTDGDVPRLDLVSRAKAADSLEAWQTTVPDDAAWRSDRELYEYLRGGELDLDRASACGLW